jgi:hypothetical protein
MTPEFEYFFWAIPDPDKPQFALYDLFDNHFVMLSHDYSALFKLSRLLDSKVTLDIVELPYANIDNSVVENWGVLTESVTHFLYADITITKKACDINTYYDMFVIKNSEVMEVQSNFDAFKTDLQCQVFFLYYCLTALPEVPDSVMRLLQRAADLGINYKDTVDKFLDLTVIDVDDKQTREDMYDFLRLTGLYYE